MTKTMTRDPIDDTALATRIHESREDVFRDLQDPDSRLNSGEGIAFQEFDRRVSEKREQLSGAVDEEGAAIAVLNDIDDRSDVALRERDQRTVSTTTRDLFSARKYQEDERSREAIARDRATNAERVTGDFERWKQQPGQLDFPGVDTRGNIGPQLAGETSSAAHQNASEDSERREKNAQEYEFSKETLAFGKTFLNEEVGFEGRDQLEPLRQKVSSGIYETGGSVELTPGEFKDFQRVVRDNANEQLDTLEGKEATIMGDAERQRKRARQAKQEIFNTAPDFGGGR